MIFEPTLFTRTPNRVIYYTSLVGVLVASIASYGLEHLALVDKAPVVGWLTIAQYSFIALCMLACWKCAPSSPQIKQHSAMLLIAVIVRILLIDAAPYTSNDASRYLFDGKIAVEGHDPYRVSHDNPSLSTLRAQWQPPAEHAKYVTLYPPLALALFTSAASTGIDNALLTWRLMLLGASLLTLALSIGVLRRANKLQHLPLIALSPLLILETHVGLHLDAFSTLGVITAIYCWQRRWLTTAGVVIGLGTLIKMLPLMLLLPLVFASENLKQAIKLVSGAVLTVTLSYVLAYQLDFQPVGSIAIFFEKWRFAAPLFVLLDSFLTAPNILVVMIVLSFIVCSTCAYFCWRARAMLTKDTALFVGVMQLSVAMPLIVSPVTFPWYLMPLVPLAALYPNRYLISWILVMPITYEVIGPFISDGIWQPAAWPVWSIGVIQGLALIALVRYSVSRWQRNRELSTQPNLT